MAIFGPIPSITMAQRAGLIKTAHGTRTPHVIEVWVFAWRPDKTHGQCLTGTPDTKSHQKLVYIICLFIAILCVHYLSDVKKIQYFM